MGTDEAATLDALIGRREILDRLIATRGGRIAASRTSWLKRLVYMWVAAVSFLSSQLARLSLSLSLARPPLS